MRLEKIMLVGAQECREVEQCLVRAHCSVAKMDDGPAALSRARREKFDAAVLVSTGKEMDLPETLFNLMDLTESMPIIVVGGVGEAGKSAIIKGMVAQSQADVRVLSLRELNMFFRGIKNFRRKRPSRSKSRAFAGKQTNRCDK